MRTTALTTLYSYTVIHYTVITTRASYLIPDKVSKTKVRQTDHELFTVDGGSWNHTCLDFGFGIKGFITGDFSLSVARLSAVDFLDDLFILSKMLVERPEFTEMAGSLKLPDT